MLGLDQIQQYRENGFCVHRRLLTADEVQDLNAELAAICGGNTRANHDQTRMEMEPNQPLEGQLVRRIYEPCTYYPAFRSLSDSSRLLDCVEQLIGPDLTFHYSKINMKPASIGSVVEWHQDLAYYPLTNQDSVSILFYLDDADRGNGCLQVIPGGHRGRCLDHTRDGYFQGRVTEVVDESLAVCLEGRAGDVIFMHCMTPHSSTTNTSSRSRRTLILSYRAADAFPIYLGEATVAAETFVRHVRGKRARIARFSMSEFPIPAYKVRAGSLYELQKRSREEISGAG
ncbi:MAG: phytanoyl-CoA dioxygenase family protein [Acidobacteriota bacterium]